MDDMPERGAEGAVPLCKTADVPTNGMRMCTAGGKEYLVAQVDGAYHVYQHKCPHLGGPLSKGKLNEGVVTCPWHGSKFDLRTGGKLKGPNVGPNIPIVRNVIALFVRNLRKYSSVVKDGVLYLQHP